MFMITWIFGLHNYIGEALSLHCEPSNLKDPHAVAVMSSDNEVVGHIPVLFSRVYSTFSPKA